MDYRNDIVVSEERLKKVGETYRLIRNTLRYQLSNLYDFNPATDTVPDERLSGLDRWILGEFATLEAAVAQAYDAYEFHVVYQLVSQFCAVQLSALYHDVVKDRLYTDPAGSARRRSTQTALHRILTRLTQALAPILAFTADEAWEQIPGTTTTSVHLSLWNPAAVEVTTEPAWAVLFSLREQALPELEKARQAKLIGKGLDAVLHFALPATEHALVAPHQDELRELCNCSAVTLAEEAERRISVQVAGEAGRKKCERCWHWELDLGETPAHPTLCGRCVEAVIPVA